MENRLAEEDSYTMKHVFYKPPVGWAGDFIPFYHDGAFQLFYLRDIRTARGHFDGIPWFRVSTRDFVDFEDRGLMIEPGGYDEQDLCIYTGSAIEKGGRVFIFYTGHNPRMRSKGRPEQGVMVAVSDDGMKTFQKLPGCMFSPEGYEDHDWRDPFVWLEESDGLYHMALAARSAEGPATRRGLTAHLTSPDLENWRIEAPLWAPESYYTHECPDVFRIGDWYYLLFSEFTDSCRTRYVMSRSLQGPWISPVDDVFDTRAFYAAKTATDGKARYLFGWNPTRVDGDDTKDFHWGGNLVVHELFQREDGSLGVKEPDSIRAAWGDGSPAPFGGADSVSLDCPDRMATAFLDAPCPDRFRLEMDVTFADKTRMFGLMLRADQEADTAYGFKFYPASSRLAFDALPEPTWNSLRTRGLDRLLPMEPDAPMHLSLVVDGTMATLYADGKVALTTRMYNYRGQSLGIFAQHGAVRFDNIRIATGF